MTTEVPIIEVKRITQTFNQFVALENINLTVHAGERVALVGASGAGKSTLLRLLNGTLRATQGEVWVLGRDLARLNPKRLRQVQREIGTVYQQFHLVNTLRVIHNVNAGHLGRWSLWKAALSLIYPLEIETAYHALKQVGIPDKIYARTDTLSGGQQQRVALARVLVQNPTIILADEPIASLDPQLSLEMMDLLRDLCLYRGKTLVVSLHSVEFVRSHCDRVIGLQQGQIAFDLPVNEVSEALLTKIYQTT
jgi:phosphonate transport system ATP-binding protein